MGGVLELQHQPAVLQLGVLGAGQEGQLAALPQTRDRRGVAQHRHGPQHHLPRSWGAQGAQGAPLTCMAAYAASAASLCA